MRSHLLPKMLLSFLLFPAAASAFQAKCFEFRDRPGGITWQDAQNECLTDGGNLAVITSAGENALAFGVIDPSQISDGVWIGGFQPPGSPEPDGNWQWVTGGAVAYDNWESGEPNDGLGANEEDAISFYTDAAGVRPTWNDVSRTYLADGYIFQTTRDLCLTATPPVAQAGDLFSLTTQGGAPGQLNMLIVTNVSGIPVFVTLLFGTFDANCEHVLSAPVPPGYAGLDVTFAAFGFKKSGGLALSNFALVQLT